MSSSRPSSSFSRPVSPLKPGSVSSGGLQARSRPSSVLGWSSFNNTSRSASPTKQRPKSVIGTVGGLPSTQLQPTLSIKSKGSITHREALFGTASSRGSIGPSSINRFTSRDRIASDSLSEISVLQDETPRRWIPKKPSQQDPESEEENEESKSENVVVCLRVRPSRTNDSEIYNFDTEASVTSLSPTHPIFIKRGAMATGTTSRDEYEFGFDALHLSPLPTHKLYNAKIRPVVLSAMQGYNGTVFAYGQTASGKTHTMLGNETEPGIIPLSIEELFHYIREQHTHRTFTLLVSFIEIYNESLRDLLAPCGSTEKVDLLSDGTVKGVTERPVGLPDEVLAILKEGEIRRKTGATDWNERSSRSHVVFTVKIESMSKTLDGSARTSRLNLIDLAGSESATGQEERRKEGAFINRSLLTLGTVIGKLSEGNSTHIPYRDSKLTRLLAPALSGNSKVAVICTISPDAEQATETLSTLKFAKRAKMVVTKAERGILLSDQMVLSQYQSQVELLQRQIAEREDQNRENEELAQQKAKVSELQKISDEAQEELAKKDSELAKLREKLAKTQSFLLDGPSLEANARRQSDVYGSGLTESTRRILSPSSSKKYVKQIADEHNSLGSGLPSDIFSTPKANTRVLSEIGLPAARVGTIEREAELEKKLERAQSQIDSHAEQVELLESQVSQLERSASLARADAEKSAQVNCDRKAALQELQRDYDSKVAELAIATSQAEKLLVIQRQLEEVERKYDALKTESQESGDNIRAEAIEAKEELVTFKKENEELNLSLKERSQRLEALQSLIKEKECAIDELKHAVESRESDIRELKEVVLRVEQEAEQARSKSLRLERKIEEQKERIERLEKEIEEAKEEHGLLKTSKESSINSARKEIDALLVERDFAWKGLKEKKDEILALHDADTKRRQEASQQSQEDTKHIKNLEARIQSLLTENQELKDNVESLERNDQQKKKMASAQKSATDALKMKMADLVQKNTLSSSLSARQGTRVFSNPPALSSSVSSVPVDIYEELKIRNGELQAEISSLRRELESLESRPAQSDEPDTSSKVIKELEQEIVIGSKECARLNELVNVKDQKYRQAKETGEEWRQKYMELQLQLDEVRMARKPRETLGEIPLVMNNSNTRSGVTKLPFESPVKSGRQHLRASTIGHGLGSSLSLSTLGWNPQPLPASPKAQAMERKTRRETIERDLEKLVEGKGVERKLEQIDKSHTKARPGLPSTFR